mgnify:CR=1 FL=1|jgi:quercetin dioxygenase-like cupin family protein
MEHAKNTCPVVVRASKELPFQAVAGGKRAMMQVLIGPRDGAPNFALRRFRMDEGGGMPLHTNSVEHEQYVLTGRGRVSIGDQVYEVQAGDVLYIPAGVPHSYEVLKGPFEFLCIVPNRADEVRIVSEPH